MRDILYNRSGIALVTVLIIIGVVTVLIAALIMMSRTEMGLALLGSKQRQSLYMAESGIERFIAEIPYTNRIPAMDSTRVAGVTWFYTYNPAVAAPGRVVFRGGDEGVAYTTRATGIVPTSDGNTIQRTIEVELLFRTMLAGGGSSFTPRYPWE